MLLAFVVLAIGLLMIQVESSSPGRKWPEVSGWAVRAIAINMVQIVSVYVAGVSWDQWMRIHRTWSSPMTSFISGVFGYLVLTFVYYWWHRWRHESPLLWRLLHQVHHSPQRIEILTSFYKHPLEIFLDSLLTSAVLYLFLGMSPEAAKISVFLSGLAELFYHWNVKTPHWIGYIIQRPESHCIHHEQDVHFYNFSDLPIWDMLFRTFRNPSKWEGRCGFGPAVENHLMEGIFGKDMLALNEATN